MKLTKLEEQGMRLTMCLARVEGQLTLPELAEQEGLSEALVAKVLGKLKNGGVVKAVRGRNGGYVLGGTPNELTVTQVLKALGRPVVDGCFQVDNACLHAENCGIRPVWMYIERRVIDVLDRVTLTDLIMQEGDVKSHLVQVEASLNQAHGEARQA